MRPKLTIPAMMRRINQQLKYAPVANVGASGLVYSDTKSHKKVCDDPIVHLIRKERLWSDRKGGRVTRQQYAISVKAEASNALAKIKGLELSNP